MSDDAGGGQAASSTRSILGRLALAVVGLAVLVTVLVYLPRIDGTTWPAVGRLLGSVQPVMLVVLALLWLTTVLAHTVVQVASLPGLGYRHALALNLGSSAVASSVPAGGPVSLAVNWSMLRSWGFGRTEFSSYTLVTTITMAVARLAVPIVAALVLVAGAGLPAVANGIVALAAAALLVVGLLTAILALPSLRRRLADASHPGLFGRVARAVDAALAQSGAVIKTQWHRLGAGAVAQLVLQYGLLLACLGVTGAYVGLGVALLAFAAGRLLSVLPVTPGGLGVTEAGVGALLVALGTPAAPAVAAVLLFGLFAVVLEIPIGAGVLVAWRLAVQRAKQPVAV